MRQTSCPVIPREEGLPQERRDPVATPAEVDLGRHPDDVGRARVAEAGADLVPGRPLDADGPDLLPVVEDALEAEVGVDLGVHPEG